MTSSSLQVLLHMRFKSFIAMGPSFRLASSLPWRSSLQGWDHKQAGAMRWLQHILPKAAAPAMQGTWEARTSHDGVCTCTYDGDTWHPLCLQAEIRGDTYDLNLTALFLRMASSGGSLCSCSSSSDTLCHIPQVAQQCGG